MSLVYLSFGNKCCASDNVSCEALALAKASGGEILRNITFSVIAIFVLSGPILADGVITLKLETPGLSSQTTKPEANQSPPKVSTVTAKAEQKQIGRVALVTVNRASIYARRSTRSKVYSVCAKDTPLAVVETVGLWYGVLMIDGSTGWIKSNSIKLLDYGVIPVKGNRGAYASRGGIERGEIGNNIVQTALQYLGAPYVYGGTSPSSGIDCSAFIRTVYAQNGIDVPRVSRDQANVGTPVAQDDLQAGDRLYFACKHPYIDHCGIYMGDGYFIHASASRGGVAVDKLTNKFYYQTLVAVMR